MALATFDAEEKHGMNWKQFNNYTQEPTEMTSQEELQVPSSAHARFFKILASAVKRVPPDDCLCSVLLVCYSRCRGVPCF